MTARNRRPSAFTLIELLVVIAIIGVLIALLLPAVQAAREAARRMQCMNNLVQLSLATQNYASAHEVYPAGVVGPPKSGPVLNVPIGHHYGWATQILPYIEQRNAYNKLNFETGVYAAANLTVRMTELSTFICPSDGFVDQVARGFMPGPIGQSSYAGCHHDVEAPIDIDNHGVFFLNSFLRYDEVPDGTSNTIFFGEYTHPDGVTLGWASGTRATLRNTGSPPGPAMSPIVGPALIHDYDPAEMARVIEELTPADGGEIDPKAIPPAALYVGGFSSKHAGGSNFALGDGSVKFIKQSVAPEIFMLLGHRADGEIISDSEY